MVLLYHLIYLGLTHFLLKCLLIRGFRGLKFRNNDRLSPICPFLLNLRKSYISFPFIHLITNYSISRTACPSFSIKCSARICGIAPLFLPQPIQHQKYCTAIGNSGHSLRQDYGIISIYLKGVSDGETKTKKLHLRV